MFNSNFSIGSRTIGTDNKVLIIAEAGVSHFGDMTLAHELIEISADAQADVFKIQIFDVDCLISNTLGEWKERLRPRNLNFEQVCEIKEACEKKGLIFLVTAHDESRIKWLDKLDVPAIKVGSGEKNNPEFIEKLAALNKPLIISTGMYSARDLNDLLLTCQKAQCNNIALMHCVTSYPTPYDQVNLKTMKYMKKIFPGPIGYSDHTEDHNAILAAIAMGANIVERHITILKEVPNAQDWKVSSGPEDFKNLIDDIRRVESMLGYPEKIIQACEERSQDWAVKRLVASRRLNKGHIVEKSDVVAKRCNKGIYPNQIDLILGGELKCLVKEDEPLLLDYFN